MDQVSTICQRRHLSQRTEEAYRFWIRRYILFHRKQHPRDVGTAGITPFVNHLATEQRVAASTQSQALNAVLFLYRDVLEIEVGHLAGLRRIQRPARLPVVMAIEEVRDVLAQMHGTPRLMAELLYGSGLRVTECMTLRIKDLNFRDGTINIRSGKGGKDRVSMLPARLLHPRPSCYPADRKPVGSSLMDRHRRRSRSNDVLPGTRAWPPRLASMARGTQQPTLSHLLDDSFSSRYRPRSSVNLRGLVPGFAFRMAVSVSGTVVAL